MFTVSIESEGGLQKSIREWPTVDIFHIGSEQFNQFAALESERIESMFLNADEQPENIKGEVDYLVGQYKAVMRSVCGEHIYFVTDNEQVYVSNQSGKTVAVVK